MSGDFRYCPRCAAQLVAGVHGGRERGACSACGWVHWENPTPVVAAVIEVDGKVLLARNKAWPAKMFGLVTGFLERDESPAEAVAREVLEETGLQCTAARLLGVYEFRPRNELIIAYHTPAVGTLALGDELAEVRLLEPARVRPWPMGTGLALADWMRTRGLTVDFLSLPEQAS